MRYIACLLVLLLAACADPVGPGRPVSIELTGRAERGSVAAFTVTVDRGRAPSVTWTAEPAAAVEWTGPGEARFLGVGPVRIVAAVGAVSLEREIQVATPPSVVFERLLSGQKDIWRVALDGGDLQALSPHPAEDRWPSLSSGKVYFVSYRDTAATVYSTSPQGGSATRVTPGRSGFEEGSPSPDGKSLVFVRLVGGVTKLFVSGPTGTGARRLTADASPAPESSATWSPDGTRIAFVSATKGTADVYVAPAAGGTPSLVTGTAAPEVEPAWSPDGKGLVFVRAKSGSSRLVLVDLASGVEREVAGPTVTYARPAWLGDGRIVFTQITGGRALLGWIDPAAPGSVHLLPGAIEAGSRPIALP